MGAESLSHGDKFKRAVASGMLLTGLSAGISLTQEPVASATPPSSEISAKIPTAYEFLSSEYNSLIRVIGNGKDFVSKTKNAPTLQILSSALGNKQWLIDPGVEYSGININLISKDKTTGLNINWGSNITTKGEIIMKGFSLSVWGGIPQSPTSALYYQFDFQFHNKAKNIQIQREGDFTVGNSNLGYSNSFGIALSNTDSSRTLTTDQMSFIKQEINDVKEIIYDVAKKDYVARRVANYGGYQQEGLVPYK